MIAIDKDRTGYLWVFCVKTTNVVSVQGNENGANIRWISIGQRLSIAW